jgi:hypothetical protein
MASCSGDDDARIALVGDSIAQEAAPYLKDIVGEDEVIERHFGGTAPCDWLDLDPQEVATEVIVVSFTGNSHTPCMTDASGEPLRGDALVRRYRTDLAALVDRFRATGARVLLVGQPARGPAAGGQEEVDGINEAYQALAEADGVSYVDAGAALETDDGRFALTMACRPGERECGPDGRNVVRTDDGVHLCPGEALAPCPVYSSGAHRFARAIADAIDR